MDGNHFSGVFLLKLLVKKYTRDGSIIVFHDSLKAERNMKYALPRAIEWLKEEGYTFELIPAIPKISRTPGNPDPPAISAAGAFNQR